MSKSSDTAQKVIILAKRFTIDKVTSFQHRGLKNLPELLSLFPNYGLGFKVFMKGNKENYFLIDKVNIINNRHADFFGLKYSSNLLDANKIEKLRNTLKQGIWNYCVMPGKCLTDNGIEYDIKKTEELIDKKKIFLENRLKHLGIVSKGKEIRAEEKKKKLEKASDKKKK